MAEVVHIRDVWQPGEGRVWRRHVLGPFLWLGVYPARDASGVQIPDVFYPCLCTGDTPLSHKAISGTFSDPELAMRVADAWWEKQAVVARAEVVTEAVTSGPARSLDGHLIDTPPLGERTAAVQQWEPSVTRLLERMPPGLELSRVGEAEWCIRGKVYEPFVWNADGHYPIKFHSATHDTALKALQEMKRWLDRHSAPRSA